MEHRGEDAGFTRRSAQPLRLGSRIQPRVGGENHHERIGIGPGGRMAAPCERLGVAAVPGCVLEASLDEGESGARPRRVPATERPWNEFGVGRDLVHLASSVVEAAELHQRVVRHSRPHR